MPIRTSASAVTVPWRTFACRLKVRHYSALADTLKDLEVSLFRKVHATELNSVVHDPDL
jgi:hypothetical protein